MSSPFDANPYSSPAVPPAASPAQVTEANAVVPSRVLDLLRQTRPWVRLMSIVGFVVSALMIIGGGAAASFAMLGRGDSSTYAMSAGVLCVYVFMGALYLVPSLFLFRYASRITELLTNPQSLNLEAALEAQKSFWKFVGILTAIVLVIYLIIIVGAILAGIGGLAGLGGAR
jgi:hypothetical protein